MNPPTIHDYETGTPGVCCMCLKDCKIIKPGEFLEGLFDMPKDLICVCDPGNNLVCDREFLHLGSMHYNRLYNHLHYLGQECTVPT